MLQFFSPPPADVASLISRGIQQANEQSLVERYDFALVYRQNGWISGGVTASVSFACLFINNIWVDKEMRARGFGKRLMAAAEEEGRARGAKTVCLDTLSSQAPGFYGKLGYVEFGRLSGEVGGQPIDRIWFRKTLVHLDG